MFSPIRFVRLLGQALVAACDAEMAIIQQHQALEQSSSFEQEKQEKVDWNRRTLQDCPWCGQRGYFLVRGNRVLGCTHCLKVKEIES